MMRFDIDGVHVLMDYAHNPDGLHAFLSVARSLRRGAGRLAVLLGHAGNRRDADIREVAQVVAGFTPDLVVVKEIVTHLRGRAPGEIPQLLRTALLQAGLAESAIAMRAGEIEAAQCALDWARPGDVLGLLVHAPAARDAVLKILDQRQARSAAAGAKP